MLKTLTTYLALVLLCLPALAQTVGRIDLVAGEVAVVDAKATPRSVKVGDEIKRGDTVTTGKDGELHATLDDGSVLAVRPEAKMQIVKFQFKEKDSDGSVVSLLRGAMRTITGLIGRRNPKGVLLQTPTATIGIRGTDHEALVILPDSDVGEPGTYDKVNAGGTSIRSARGSVDISPGQAGFASLAAPPVVLASVPSFFKPTANEKRLEGVNDAIQRSFERRGSGTAGKPGGKGATQIQGNTRINANGSNLSATASGSDNQAGNRVGTIGGD